MGSGNLDSLSFAFDSLWCGKTQLPASLLLKLSDRKKIPAQLALFRFYIALCVFLQILGTFLITVGLFSSKPIELLIAGICLKVFGGLCSSFFQNRAGVLCSLEIQDSLKNLKTHAQEISGLLGDKGCSEAEIQAIYNLPSEVYQSELNSYKQSNLLNFGNPLACGIALLINGEIGTSIMVIILGLLSFPIGEYFFKEHTFRNEAQLRIGKSSQIISYLHSVYQEHIALTLRVNALSQAPLILFGMRFFWSTTGQLLPIFYGLTQGLAGLTGTLAFQRSRVSALRSTEIAEHLIEILAGPSFIITPVRWKEHQLQPQTAPPLEMKKGLCDGVAFIDFSSKYSLRNEEIKLLPTITCGIPRQGVCILQAPSGRGKSTFLAAILHLIEHSGGFYFVDNKHWSNIHCLNRETFDKNVVFFKEENIEKSARIVDLFKDVVLIKLFDLQKQMVNHFGETLTGLAWHAADNLIEREIANIKKKQRSVFPSKMVPELERMRHERSILVDNFCKQSGGNLATPQIFPERIFSTLSSGERRRVITTLSFEKAATCMDVKLLILDEPLAHLDFESIQMQILTLRRLQELPHSPAMLIISHLHLDELRKQLSDVQILSL